MQPGTKNGSKAIIEQVCIPVGCVPAARRPYAGVCFPGGVVLHRGGPRGVPWGVLHAGGSPSRGGSPSGGSPSWGGFSIRGGSPSQGGSPSGGGMASQHALRQTPSPRGQTDTCKNITLATTSLRPVIKTSSGGGFVKPMNCKLLRDERYYHYSQYIILRL